MVPIAVTQRSVFPHGDMVDSLGRHGRGVVAILCDGGFTEASYTKHLRHGSQWGLRQLTNHNYLLEISH